MGPSNIRRKSASTVLPLFSSLTADSSSLGVAWFAVVVMLSSILPFMFPVFPSQDGPSHIGTSGILDGVLFRGVPQFATFFEVLPLSTNSLIHYIGIPLVHVFPAQIAEEFIVAGLIGGGALALWSCARALPARNTWICAFFGVAGYSLTLYTGNYNFLLSFILLFCIVRHVLAYAGKFGASSTLWLAALFVLAGLAHPIGAIFAATAMAVLVLWEAVLATAHLVPRDRSLAVIRRVWPATLATAPVALFLGHYLLSNLDAGAEFGPGFRYGPSLLHRLQSFLGLRQLYTVDNWQKFVCMFGATCLIVLTTTALLGRWRELQSGATLVLSDGVPIAAAAMLGLFLIIPDGGAGAGYIVSRLDLVPWLLVLVWLCSRDLNVVGYAAGAMLAGPVTIVLLATNAAAIAKFQPELAQAGQFEAFLDPGSTVLTISARPKPVYAFPRQGYLQNDPFVHMQHHAAANRGIVMLNNWNSHYPGFPIRFRRAVDPYRFFDPVSIGDKDLVRFEAETGQRIDAVVVNGADRGGLAARSGALLERLDHLFCQAESSAALGSVFVRRTADRACPSAASHR